MGDRAVITTLCEDVRKSDNIGIYLNKCGERDSIEAILAYCKLKGYRTPETDNYGWARLCQVIGNYLGEETGLGIDICRRLDCDNSQNGVYVIENWEIVGRQYHKGEESINNPLYEMLCAINESQPYEEQIELQIIQKYCNMEIPKEKTRKTICYR